MIFLNWRIWAFAAFVGIIGASGYTGFKEGEKSAQARFDAYRLAQDQQAIAAEQAARAKEQVLNSKNAKVSADYETLKTATATAVAALDADRMRLQSALAAAGHPAAKDTGTSAGPDDSPESRILGECLQRYEAVAVDADALSDQVRALQGYIAQVVSP